mgnify:CR=1 FL=1
MIVVHIAVTCVLSSHLVHCPAEPQAGSGCYFDIVGPNAMPPPESAPESTAAWYSFRAERHCPFPCAATLPLTTGAVGTSQCHGGPELGSEAALEELALGKKVDEVAPFWRVVKAESKLAAKLNCAPTFIQEQRALEGL